MSNPRQPVARAAVSGAASKNPQRHRGRTAPKRTRAVGDPYKSMTIQQREAWEVFCAELPWLTSAHRSLLQLACMLRARIESDPDIGISTMQVYSAVLSKLGATPADESKISHTDDDEPDPADRFFN